jgi:hypothetical protein
MPATGRAFAFSWIAVKKHHVTFLAIAPVCLIITIACDVMRQAEFIALCCVWATGRAFAFIGKSVEEHRETLAAISPVDLGLCGFDKIIAVRQIEVIALCVVSSAPGTSPFGRETIVEKRLAFIAKTPLVLRNVVVGKRAAHEGGNDQRSGKHCSTFYYEIPAVCF